MEKPIMIQADHVYMKFSLSSEKFDSFKEYVIKSIKKQVSYDEFWALKDVSFELRKGDALGLIGLNGSGKSTMLKTIAGVLKPTKGSVTVNGSIAPLIELGAGFDMDLTARENVFLNGALLGYSRKQMQEYKRFYGCTGKEFLFWYGFKIGICDCNNRNAGYSYCRRSAFCWGLSIPREMRTTYTEDDEWRNDNSFCFA